MAEARSDGLRFLSGGEPSGGPGFFVPPTLVDNPPDEARIVREEVFGPVRSLLKYSDIDEAVLNVLHLKMNYMNDPVLEEPRFVEVFSRIQGE